jgi:hypothetical protein
METERIALSQRERDRLHVLHELQAFHAGCGGRLITQILASINLEQCLVGASQEGGFSQHLAVLYTYQ